MMSASKLDRAREMICGVTTADKSTAIAFRHLLKSALPDNTRSGQQSVLFAAANERFLELLAAIVAENHKAIKIAGTHLCLRSMILKNYFHN